MVLVDSEQARLHEARAGRIEFLTMLVLVVSGAG